MFRVKSMLAQLTALLFRIGYLDGSDDKCRDFLEFIVRLCALPVQSGEEVRTLGQCYKHSLYSTIFDSKQSPDYVYKNWTIA
jgi:hypothetical protein